MSNDTIATPTTAARASSFRKDTDLNITENPAAIAAVRALKEARAAKAEAEAAIKEATDTINAIRGDKTRLLVRSFPVLVAATVEREDFRRSVLRDAFPEAWEAARYTNPYVRLNVLS